MHLVAATVGVAAMLAPFAFALAAPPDTMRAAVITQCLGSPANFSVIVPQNLPVPTPKANEVLVRAVGGRRRVQRVDGRAGGGEAVD